MRVPSDLRVPRLKLSLFLALIAITAFLGQVAVAKAASEPIVEVEPHEGSAYVGETFAINITIVNVQNLYALEVTLYWNASILQEKSIDLRLGCESHPDGVLHELPNASIFIAENNVTQGQYSLAATETAPAPTFNGSGNIVRITFSIISPGNCTLSLESQLYDYQIIPIIQQPISNPIDHTTIGGSLEALPATQALTNISVYGYTDKTNYNSGDTVTANVFIYESGTGTINLINVTVIYPWYSIIWGGNQTINAKNTAIFQGESWNFTASFTIPTDGRASSGPTTISYYYKVGSITYQGSASPSSLYLHINSVPSYISFENMGTLITIIMVQAVLLIISALIIAATIFLSARRPKVKWKAEAKE